MINAITVHEVTAAQWQPKAKDATELEPNVLIVTTATGDVRIALFPLRPAKDAPKELVA